MRRIIVVLGVFALAAAAAALAASGGSAKTDHGRSPVTSHHQWILPGVRYAVITSAQNQTCYVSSADQTCSLTPCRGFVADSVRSVVTTGSADWIPVTPQCHGQRRRLPTAVVPSGMALLTGAVQRVPRLVARPHH